MKRSDSLLPLPAIRIGSLSREKRSVDTIYRGGEERERERDGNVFEEEIWKAEEKMRESGKWWLRGNARFSAANRIS